MKNEKVEKIVNKDGDVKVYLEESDQAKVFTLAKNHKVVRNEDEDSTFDIGSFMTEEIDGEETKRGKEKNQREN